MRSGFQVDRIDHEEMMRSRAAYFACVSHLDQVLGDLLLRLEHDGLLENTIIIYSTDHGEMAGEHGVWWKNGWYEACTRIPLIVSLPQQRRGELAARTESTPVALIDLFPTLCALAGVPSPDGLDGVDLSPALTQRQSPPQRPIVCDNLTQRWGEGTQFRAVRLGNYKYVAFKDAPPLFFDLLHDPQEQHNLLESATQDALETLEALKRFVSASIDFDAVDMEREAGEAALKERYPMSIPKRDGNQYLMPSGRLVDGDDMLYAPEVLAEQAADIFGDWPGA